MMIREPLIWSMQNVFIFRLYEWSSGGVYNAKPVKHHLRRMAFVVRKREYDNFSYLTMICFFLGLKEGKAIERNGSLKIFCAVNCISETLNYQVGQPKCG